ncbi:MAG: class I SAM-dependent methyltransferase [Gammaproteobacteria bacterium]|nr:class I SAM-dependent methyltransferase [Gammaproteobacteria bacterium]
MNRKIAWTAALVAFGLGWNANADLAAALGSASRAAEDRARDAGRKPAEVIAYLGIGDGMTVMDLMASGGYYTEVLSLAVGPTGRVYAQNTPLFLQFADGMYDKAMTARLADGRLGNVERVDRDLGELGMEPGSLDAAFTALNFHDVHNGLGEDVWGGDAAAAGFLRVVKMLLKPGGVLGIVDHYGDADKDNTGLHRLDVVRAAPILEASGFIVESSAVLRNPADDRTTMVFDPAIRGQTDRVLYKLTKPPEIAPTPTEAEEGAPAGDASGDV